MTEAFHRAAKAHFLRRIEQTPLQQAPTPHALIRQVFPQPYFARLLDLSTKADTYNPTRDAENYAQECHALTGHLGERHHMWVKPTQNFPCDDSFLCGLASWITAPDVLTVLDQAYRAPISNGSLLPPEGASMRLVRESGVSYIRPHIDKPFKIMTLVFFLADGVDPSCPGTELYAAKPTDPAKALPTLCTSFEGNSVFIMPRTPHSWHGVAPVILDHPRNTLHIYLKKRRAA